jgi:hypothetical protein
MFLGSNGKNVFWETQWEVIRIFPMLGFTSFRYFFCFFSDARSEPAFRFGGSDQETSRVRPVVFEYSVVKDRPGVAPSTGVTGSTELITAQVCTIETGLRVLGRCKWRGFIKSFIWRGVNEDPVFR